MPSETGTSSPLAASPPLRFSVTPTISVVEGRKGPVGSLFISWRTSLLLEPITIFQVPVHFVPVPNHPEADCTTRRSRESIVCQRGPFVLFSFFGLPSPIGQFRMKESRRRSSPSSGRTEDVSKQKVSTSTNSSVPSAVASLMGRGTEGRRPRRTILREEEYLSTLGAILRRDFFPTLDQLEAQREYLTAMERDDLVALREAADRLNILEHRRQQQTSQLATTSRTGDLNLSLDEFQARYVTEDTAEFEELLARINAARLAKYRKTFCKNTMATLALSSVSQSTAPALASSSSSLMLRAAPDSTISQGCLGEVCPERTRIEAEVELGMLERDPTDIRYHYWRMLREYGSGEERGREPSVISSSISQMGGGDACGPHYNFVETPQRGYPGITETPMRDPNHFRIPPTPSRDVLGHRMAVSITAASPASASLLLSSASPGSSHGLRERKRKLLLKSPAVQRLLRAHTPRRTDSVFDTPRRPNK